MLELNKIYLGDCLQVMKDIADKSIDAIITDPPYGTTACKWDSVIPFEPMWAQLKRIIKPNGAIVLFGSEPFSSALRMSNIKNYKYDWKWDKVVSSNQLLCKKQPLRVYEDIVVFYKKQCLYNPQMELRGISKERPNAKETINPITGHTYAGKSTKDKLKYPSNKILVNKMSKELNSSKPSFHPTQKPVALMEYLIKTYTNENETVLDFTIGSGTTAIACINTNRNFIGIEKEEKYCEIARERIKQAKKEE